MKITFDTKNIEECKEVLELLTGAVVTINPDGVEAPKEEKTTPTMPEPEKAPEAPKKKPVKKAEVSLAELKEIAKAKVMVSGKDKVKEIISEYAEKLAEVKESDYAELAKKLAV